MQHMILAQSAPVGAARCAMVEPIVREIVEDVASHEARVERPAKLAKQAQPQAQTPKIQRKADCRRHEQPVLVTRPTVVNPVHEKVHALTPSGRALPVEGQAMQPVLGHGPEPAAQPEQTQGRDRTHSRAHQTLEHCDEHPRYVKNQHDRRLTAREEVEEIRVEHGG